MDPDEFYKNIERKMMLEFSTTGAIENAYLQTLGKAVNHDFYNTNSYNEMLEKIGRIMAGKKGNRWDGQNKMTDTEKATKQYKKENNL